MLVGFNCSIFWVLIEENPISKLDNLSKLPNPKSVIVIYSELFNVFGIVWDWISRFVSLETSKLNPKSFFCYGWLFIFNDDNWLEIEMFPDDWFYAGFWIKSVLILVPLPIALYSFKKSNLASMPTFNVLPYDEISTFYKAKSF